MLFIFDGLVKSQKSDLFTNSLSLRLSALVTEYLQEFFHLLATLSRSILPVKNPGPNAQV